MVQKVIKSSFVILVLFIYSLNLCCRDDSSETSETAESESTPKKRGRGKRAASEPVDDASESGDLEMASTGSESSVETKKPTPAKRGRKKGEAAAPNKKGDNSKNVEDIPESNVNSGSDSVDDSETSQEVKDTSSQDTENTTPPPPKKRILKRTVAEAEKQAQQAATKKGRKNSASDSQDKTKGQSEKKGPQKKGKGVLNGENKKNKGAKRTAEESDSEQSEESVSPKKRKFNLEKDAVPAPKLGRKAAANRRFDMTLYS